ncbi:MAG: thiamine pyrophosphate-binding protein [Synechococcaceae cyanobacterium]|nr:thiamine pyrophosphate-binding protein [Synechococcaceae cyanobacterium]
MQIVEALIEALVRRGVSRVYGFPGEYELGLFERLEASPIEVICTAGEEGAGFAADVHARLHGLGVAVVTYGVGALKLLNPVAGAYVERSPLLVISGAPGVRESDENDLLHHRMRAGDTQLRFFQEVTAESAVLDSARTAGAELLKVLRAMQRDSRPGYLELPRDCLTREIPWALDLAPTVPPLAIPESLRRQGEEQLAWLRSRRAPVVLAGVEVARFGLQQALLQLLEREGWPVATSLSGKGVVPERHPLCLGIYEGAMSPAGVRARVEGSDGLVVLGMPLNDLDTGIFTMDLEDEHCLQVEVGRGLRRGRLQNENLDPLTLLRIWTEAPGPAQRGAPAAAAPSLSGPPSFAPEAGRAITVTRLMEAIDASLPADGIVLADPGDALFGSAELHLQEASHHLSSAYWASLGFALPGAIGAWGARPDRLPVVLVGDGAFLMSCIELATLARYRIPALVIVLDNRGYGTERPMLDGPFNDVQPVDHRALAHSMGLAAAERVDTEETLWESLQRWQRHRTEPVLLSVALPPADTSPALQRLTAALRSKVKGRP